MATTLGVRDLVKAPGDVTAVSGMPFDITEGEVFGVLGPIGAGKTTTTSVLSTLYTPTSGDAVIGGRSVSEEPMAVRRLIGVLSQDLAVHARVCRGICTTKEVDRGQAAL